MFTSLAILQAAISVSTFFYESPDPSRTVHFLSSQEVCETSSHFHHVLDAPDLPSGYLGTTGYTTLNLMGCSFCQSSVSLVSWKEAPVRKSPLRGLSPLVAYSSLAALDYWSTKRALDQHPEYGYEANPMIACGRGVCDGRYWAFNIAGAVGFFAFDRWLIPSLPVRSRKPLTYIMWSIIGARGAVVTRNTYYAFR